MKKRLVGTTLFALIAAVLVTIPPVCRAGDSTNAPATTAPASKKHGVPFHGKIAAVDPTAPMTFTVGTMTMAVTSETKITKDGQPAVFADIIPGARVRGYYKKDAAGKLTAVSVRIGEKKKKAAPPAQ